MKVVNDVLEVEFPTSHALLDRVTSLHDENHPYQFHRSGTLLQKCSMSSQGSDNDIIGRAVSRERDRLDNNLEGDLTNPEKHSILSQFLRTAARNAKVAPLNVSCTLLPSFVLSRLRTRIPSISLNNTRSTSALDGIRGWACVAVLNHHNLWVYQPLVHYGYGLSQEDMAACIKVPEVAMRNDHLLRLPFVRLLHAGTASVSAFFIMLGFVLAYKPLMLSRKGRWQDILSTLAFSIFRRGIRLYLPSIAASFFVVIQNSRLDPAVSIHN